MISQRQTTNLLSASFLLHATIPKQAPPAHHRQKTLLANISSGQLHPVPGGFRFVFPMYSSQRDFLQRLRQTSTPCTPSPPMSAWHRVSVSQHEYALSCAASNAGGFRYTADPLLVGLDQEMMGLFNLARAFVFPALTALSLIETFQKPADQTTDLPSATSANLAQGLIRLSLILYADVRFDILKLPVVYNSQIFCTQNYLPKTPISQKCWAKLLDIFFVQANLNFFGRVSISKFA